MVARSTRLNADQAWLKAFKECQDLCSSQSAVEYNLAIVIDTMDLKNVLGQIKADCCNLYWVAPLIRRL